MNRLTENLLLLMVGLAIAIVATAGTYTRYVKPSLFSWLIAAAVLVTALALTAIVRDARRWTRGEAEPRDGHRQHDGYPRLPSVVWLLALPVAVLVFVPPAALGAAAASGPSNNNVTVARRHAFPSLPPGRAPDLAVTDVLLRVANDTAGTLDDRLITVVGFTVKKGAETDLGRFYIICCAADAHLHRLMLTGPAAAAAAGYPANTWLSVEGRVVPGTKPPAIPQLVVTQVRQVDQPADPYEYPS